MKLNAGGAAGSGSGLKILGPLQPGVADKDRPGQLLQGAPRSHKARYVLVNEVTGEPLVGEPYTLKRADGNRVTGYTNEEGKTFLIHSSDPAAVELLTPDRKPEPLELLLRAGETGPRELNLDYRNANPEGE